MFESILQRYSFTGVDTSGEEVGDFGLSAGAGVTYVIVGHTEPLELVHDGGAGDALPIPAGLTVISGPYRDASGGAPRLIRATGASTDVDVIAVREEGSDFRHEPLGDVVRIDDADPVDVLVDDADPVDVDLVAQALESLDIRATFLLGEANPITSGSSEQSVPLVDPDTGETLTDGNDRLDVSGYGALTVRVVPGASGADFRVRAYSSTFGSGDDIFDETGVSSEQIVGVESRDITGVREIEIFENGTDGEDQQIAAYLEV